MIIALGDVEVGRWSPSSTAPLDLAIVDRLARLALAARRRGVALRLSDPVPELVGLLELVGITFENVADPEPGASPG